ncbi:MAG TPA: RagB/SusD family nutrient uptake outer membrane protein [Puia sp.]|nr:RagB/SusD family nutrient uptake outer membrane protein [Puia sp.]
MKPIITILSLTLLGSAVLSGCKKSFLNRPPLASPTSGTFYQSDDEILKGVEVQYNASWSGYNGTSLNYIGDVMGGNMTIDNYNGRGAYLNFAVSATDPSGALESAYQAFWYVVANANVIADNIRNAGPGASEGAKLEGLAECYFQRAAAYYYLALNWGAVPIIYNNSAQIGDSTIRRNNLTDAWKFMIMDLSYAAKNLPAAPVKPGHISKWSAEGMLARAYLVRAGLTGTGGARNQSDLDSAKYWAADVCHNSGLALESNYYDLFTYEKFSGMTVPDESLFSLLWVPTGQWFVQNHMQANLAYDVKITQTGDGWGGSFGGSASLMAYYLDPANSADTMRRRATVFMPGDYYPDINKPTGWWVDTALFNSAKIYTPGAQGNGVGNDHAFVKKYVIGSPSDNGGQGAQQDENLNTYMMRLSEVYLIYADAILGNSASTSDAEALKYFNLVRSRAGAYTKNSISYADLMLERKVEFAFEGKAWYDWKSWYYFDPTDALNYFSTQNRGNYNLSPNGFHTFISYFNSDNHPNSDGSPGSVTYPITAAKVDLPYPEAEALVAPALGQPPVAFDFSKIKY